MLVSGIDARRVFLKGLDLSALLRMRALSSSALLTQLQRPPGADVPGLAMSRALGDMQASFCSVTVAVKFCGMCNLWWLAGARAKFPKAV